MQRKKLARLGPPVFQVTVDDKVIFNEAVC
jgi:hypothetical protein